MLQKIIISFSLTIALATGAGAQVNLQTGSAVFSLSMLNWQDDKSRLNSSIGLSYNSGNGLKVTEVASNVGQGWQLQAGGVITRMQVGEPDDQQAYGPTNNDNDVTRYPAGYMYAPYAASLGCPQALTKYPIYKPKNQIYNQHNTTAEDRQLDYFSFSFNGKSGMFVISGGKGVSLGDTKMKIAYTEDLTMRTNLGIRTTISKFTIQDVDGLTYIFAKLGTVKVLRTSFSNAAGTQQAAAPKIGNGGIYYQSSFDLGPGSAPYTNGQMAYPYIVGGWYLSEVDDSLTQRKIIYSYHMENLASNAGNDVTYNNSLDKYVIIGNKTSYTSTPILDSITFPDGHFVRLNYATDQRYDLPGDYPLASVDILYQGRYVSEYQLTTSYFIKNRLGAPTSDYQVRMSRLCLRSVKKIGVDLKEDTPPYVFDYYVGSNAPDDFVPPPFSWAKDIWGYYNGSNSVAYDGTAIPDLTVPVSSLNFNQLKGICFQNSSAPGQLYLNPKSGYARNGLLKQIIYPTGGSITYTYAQNMGVFNGTSGADRMMGGVHVDSTKSTDGGYSNGCNNPIITAYNYVAGSASSLWGVEQPVNYISNTNYYTPEDKIFHFSWGCGLCWYWKYMYPGIQSHNEAIGLTFMQSLMNTLSPILGIMSIIMDVVDVINVCLDATPAAILAVAIDVIAVIFTLVWSYFADYSKTTPNTLYYNFDLNGVAPLPAQFKRVEVTESPGTIGKTVYDFTSSADYPLWSWAFNNPYFSAKQRFAPWAYGLPKTISVYDVNGNIIKQTRNVYDTSHAISPILTASCKCQVNNSYSQRNPDWSKPAIYDAQPFQTVSNADMGVDIYNMFSGRVLLDTTYETTFTPGTPSQSLTTFTHFTYNSVNNYEVNHVISVQSNGDTVDKVLGYSSDFTGGVLSTLNSVNAVNIPVATRILVHKLGNSVPQVLSEKVTEFVRMYYGDVKPLRILEQRTVQPVTSMAFYSGPSTTNYANYKIPQTYTYDNYDNLIGMQDEGGRKITNIWGYKDKYVIASVINADALTDFCAYTSFEQGALDLHGWTTNTTGYTANNNAPTGNYVMNLSGGGYMSASGLNTAKAYTLSFWATTSNMSVNAGAVLTKSAPTINGFTYYEYNIPQGAASVTLTASGTGPTLIDEVRLYPATARMRTVTYDPLIGKTSEADENNRITYYTYDNLGRVQFIEDENRNILKSFEYNVISDIKRSGCPTVYKNKMATETFTRTNCGAGYQGGTITYTVPADKYSSTISQWSADVQAEMELLQNGPVNANTNGACILIYYNAAVSVSDSTETCADGLKGGYVTYSVPAGRYSSIISQADADQQAQDDIYANAQAYANDPAHAVCQVNTSPDWLWQETDSAYCLTVNGALPAHRFLKATDVNPNSSTYNQQQWMDAGPTDVCPSNTYYNAKRSQQFTKSCSTGYTGSVVTYTVQPGVYSSTVSQAAADQLAINDINANGQNYANANGTCTLNACNSTNCTGAAYKCVNNGCQLGTKIYDTSKPASGGGYTCTYHYEWTDGTSSPEYSEHHTTPCPL